ncbi:MULTISPECIES: 30S ribosomal protein S20 [Thermodesulfitimonas]|uniref:Small ribosomal subunit protein bS20 n=1 Tax=Thermodesulfitimonas autotrophica TaxID=1894989 RepID=A0A3N5ANP4_9THEO|nr:30S ribosomal protein S20 [Thermodesulfitimonas autotrophica]RPF46709.1 small subunit ribosomal protein S20 [Thermodesulfitimonas autotrophica]
MAKKSSLKRLRQIQKRTLRNASLRSWLRTAIKKFEKALAAGEADVEEKLRFALRAIDKAWSKGIIHKNTAARKKSRLMKKFNKNRLAG